MGCKPTKSEAEKQQDKRNKEVEKDLRERRREIGQEVKLLLLGTPLNAYMSALVSCWYYTFWALIIMIVEYASDFGFGWVFSNDIELYKWGKLFQLTHQHAIFSFPNYIVIIIEGTGESGKSTIAKQMKILHQGNIFITESTLLYRFALPLLSPEYSLDIQNSITLLGI